MYAIYDAETGVLDQVEYSLDGHDLTGFDTLEVAEDWADTQVWDTTLRAPVPAPLGPYQQAAKARVDEAAASLRATMLTDVFGQEMLYLAKETEARACMADAIPDAANYPLLAAEVGITGATLADVAVAVTIKADEWRAGRIRRSPARRSIRHPPLAPSRG